MKEPAQQVIGRVCAPEVALGARFGLSECDVVANRARVLAGSVKPEPGKRAWYRIIIQQFNEE